MQSLKNIILLLLLLL